MLRVAEPTQRFVGEAYLAASRIHLGKGDWTMARSLLEHGIPAFGNAVLNMPNALAYSALVLAQLAERSEALTRLREGEQLLERHAELGLVPYVALAQAPLLLHLPPTPHNPPTNTLQSPPSPP